MRKPVAILALVLLLFSTPGYSAQEFRARLSGSKATVETLASDVEAEMRFGRDVAAKIVGRYGLYDDDKLTRYINLVGQGVAAHGGRPELTYRFAVLDTDSVNAFAAPGGYIFVTKGALNAMHDEAELAAVLAHEVAHVIERHIVRELNIQGSDSYGQTGLVRFLGGAGDPTRAAFSQAIDKAMELLLTSGLKREDEFAADRIGTSILTITGYDPRALERYLARIAGIEENQVLATTHPPFGDRLRALETLLSEEGLAQAAGAFGRRRFKENVSGIE